MRISRLFIVLIISFTNILMHGASSSDGSCSEQALTPTWFNLPVPEITSAPIDSVVLSRWPSQIIGFAAPVIACATFLGGAAYLKHKGLINYSMQKTLTFAGLPSFIAGLRTVYIYAEKRDKLNASLYLNNRSLQHNFNLQTIITMHNAAQQDLQRNVDLLNRNDIEAADTIISETLHWKLKCPAAIENELKNTIYKINLKSKL